MIACFITGAIWASETNSWRWLPVSSPIWSPLASRITELPRSGSSISGRSEATAIIIPNTVETAASRPRPASSASTRSLRMRTWRLRLLAVAVAVAAAAPVAQRQVQDRRAAVAVAVSVRGAFALQGSRIGGALGFAHEWVGDPLPGPRSARH